MMAPVSLHLPHSDILLPNSHPFFSLDTFVSPFTFSRQGLSRLTWLAEVLCLFLTFVYTVIVFNDHFRGSGNPLWTDRKWFADGFCVWTGDQKPFGGFAVDRPLPEDGVGSWWNSHTASFVGDQLLGVPLNLMTWYYFWYAKSNPERKNMWKSHHRTPMLISLVVNFFICMHGVAHLSIYKNPRQRPAPEFFFSFENLGRTAGFFIVASVLPVMMNRAYGMPLQTALVVHGAISVYFPWNPPHYGFGIIQFLINLWFCLPRIGWLPTGEPAAAGEDSKKEMLRREREISARVDGGMWIASLSMPALMVIPFLELLACENFLGQVGGHFWYDFSTVVVGYLTSWEIFRNVREVESQKIPVIRKRPSASSGNESDVSTVESTAASEGSGGSETDEEPFEGYKRVWLGKKLKEEGNQTSEGGESEVEMKDMKRHNRSALDKDIE